MPREIVLVERPEQLAHLPKGAAAIGLTPLVELEEPNCRRPEDYSDEEALESEGIENFGRVERVCELIDDAIQDQIPLARELQVRPAYCHFFQLKVLFDGLFCRSLYLARMLDAEQPEVVTCFEAPEADLESEWWSADESLYAPVLAPLAEDRGVTIRRLPAVPVPARPRLHHRVRLPLTYRLNGWFRNGLEDWRDRYTLRTDRRADGTVLCLDFQYDVPNVARELMRRGRSVWLWEEGNRPRRPGLRSRTADEGGDPDLLRPADIEQARCEVLSNPVLRAQFLWHGTDCFPAVSSRLSRLFRVCLPDAIRHARCAERVLAQLGPSLVLASNLWDPRRKTIALTARRMGVPVVVAHHGGLGNAHIPMMIHQNSPADGYFCYGPGTAAYFRKYCGEGTWTAVGGAPRIDHAADCALPAARIRRCLRLSARRPVVLYLVTNMHGNYRYFSYQLPSDSVYFRTQKRIAAVLGAHRECQVIVKDHPGSPYFPLAQWVQMQGWGHVKPLLSPSYSELLNVADTVVMDLPATAILQALRSRASVYVFNDWFRWEPMAREALEQSVYYSDDIDAFCDRLDRDLDTGRAFAGRDGEDPYSEMFCVRDPDRSLFGRAVAALDAFSDERLGARNGRNG